MVSIHLTPQQEALTRALVACGYYGNVSEVGRAAIDRFFQELPDARRREVALHLYREGQATVSRFAEIAGMPYGEAYKLLMQLGIARTGTGADEATIRAQAKKLADKYLR